VINTNLSTRPFYNERVVHLALLLFALIVLLASVFNATRMVQLSRSDTRQATQASRDEKRAADLRRAADRLRGTVDSNQLELVSVQARRANDLIDRRTFSWTDLFNRFETTLPDEVRITSMRPRIVPKEGTVLTITVVARSVDDINEFVQNLEKNGAFANVLPVEDRANEGLIEAIIEMKYSPAPTGKRGP
jgi:type IV pilus assembly protein PilN